MGRFSTGFCLGLGLSLLFTPKTGEEMRHLVAERIRRSISAGRQEPLRLVEQDNVQLEEEQNRAELASPMPITAAGTSPSQETASPTGEAQQTSDRAVQQTEEVPSIVSTAQEMPSSTPEIQQNLEWDTPQAEEPTPTPEKIQEVTESVKEEQWNLNESARQASSTVPIPTTDIVQEPASSAKDVPQSGLAQPVQQTGTTTPDKAQKTAKNKEETQKDPNRATRQAGKGNTHNTHHRRSRR
jgi:hypothetical protein